MIFGINDNSTNYKHGMWKLRVQFCTIVPVIMGYHYRRKKLHLLNDNTKKKCHRHFARCQWKFFNFTFTFIFFFTSYIVNIGLATALTLCAFSFVSSHRIRCYVPTRSTNINQHTDAFHNDNDDGDQFSDSLSRKYIIRCGKTKNVRNERETETTEILALCSPRTYEWYKPPVMCLILVCTILNRQINLS